MDFDTHTITRAFPMITSEKSIMCPKTCYGLINVQFKELQFIRTGERCCWVFVKPDFRITVFQSLFFSFLFFVQLEELRADIVDMKEMYREQVDLLVNKVFDIHPFHSGFLFPFFGINLICHITSFFFFFFSNCADSRAEFIYGQ